MVKNKTIINNHAKKYISAVFEQPLRLSGFTCPDEKLLCWYRVRNQTLLDTVIFCSSWSNLPLMMDMYYETVPLFTNPVYIQNVNYNGNSRWDCYKQRPIREIIDGVSVTLAPFSEDIWVDAPLRGGRGLYTLTEIVLPYFAQIQTVNDCYYTHKQSHSTDRPTGACPRFFNMSREFVDEALYVNDKEVIPHCSDRIARALQMCENLISKKPRNQALKEEQALWQQLYNAICEEKSEAYLDILRQRQQKNISYLSTKFGIDIR